MIRYCTFAIRSPRQIEPAACDIRVRQSDLNRNATLRRAHVDHAAILRSREFCRQRLRHRQASGGLGASKSAERGLLGIKRRKIASRPGAALRLSRSKRRSQSCPDAVIPRVEVLHQGSDIAWLGAVKICVRRPSVCISSVPIADQQPEGTESIEEVVRTAFVDPNSLPKSIPIEWSICQRGE